MTNDRAHRIANYWMNKPASDVKFGKFFSKNERDTKLRAYTTFQNRNLKGQQFRIFTFKKTLLQDCNIYFG